MRASVVAPALCLRTAQHTRLRLHTPLSAVVCSLAVSVLRTSEAYRPQERYAPFNAIALRTAHQRLVQRGAELPTRSGVRSATRTEKCDGEQLQRKGKAEQFGPLDNRKYTETDIRTKSDKGKPCKTV